MAEFVKIEGALSWVKVDPNNPEPPFGSEKAGKWSSCVHPKPEGIELIRDLQAMGLKNIVKKDENGYYTKFSRPVARYNKDGVKTKDLDPPKLTGAEPKEIGNGSLGTLTLEVYEHATPGGGKAKAARLYAVDITRLTPRT